MSTTPQPDIKRLLEAFPTKEDANNGLKFWADMIADMGMSKVYGVKVEKIYGGQGWWGCFAQKWENGNESPNQRTRI
jgi:hypothetical protein